MDAVIKSAWKTCVSSLVMPVLMVVAVLIAIFIPQAAYAAGGSLQVTSTNGSSATYRAVCIADTQGLPHNESFDWQKLSGAQAPGYDAYPTYDANSSTAARDGRDLVQCVSDDLQHDEDGSLAYWLSAYVRKDASAVSVAVDAAPVNVADGWYILTAPGRRPLFAWVEGAPVELGDKADAPVLTKEINAGDGWSEAAVGGSGRTFAYRVSLTVPHTFELYSAYYVTFHDEHDEWLALDPMSLKVELLRPVAMGNAGEKLEPVADLTERAVLEQQSALFTVAVPNLRDMEARPGDVVRVSYRMSVDPLVAPGSNGLVNDAWATYPASGASAQTSALAAHEDATPRSSTRAYLVHANIRKVNAAGTGLEGALFAVRNGAGAWLVADGTFGAEGARATFTTDADGLATDVPALAPGSYELVEVRAPNGYELPSTPVFPFELAARATFETLSIDVAASESASVESVSARDASFTLRLVNSPVGATPGGQEPGGQAPDEELPITGGWLAGLMPQTGDAPWLLAAGLLVLVGAALIAVGARKRGKAE